MIAATRLKGILSAALAFGLVSAFSLLPAENGPGEFNVGQILFSGNWAGIGQSCWIIVRNRTGQNVSVRFTNKDSTYTGPNWIHMFGDGLGDAYWLQHPNDGGLRFGTHYETASGSYPAGANSDTRMEHEGTVSGFQFDPYNFGGLVDPKSPRYRYQGWGDQPTVAFVERHTVMMEKYIGGGIWEKVDEKPVTWGVTFRPRLVAGSSFANHPGAPVWMEFTLGPEFKPAEAKAQVLLNPSSDPEDQARPAESCGISGATTGRQRSVDLSFKLTGDNFGRYPAALRFYQAQIDKTVYDPRLLTVAGFAQVTMSYDAATSAVTQFQTQNDVVVVDDPSATDELFVLKFHVRDPSWTAAAGTPLPVTGTPHTTVTIQNPDRTLQTHNRLSATRVTPDKTETWDYTHTAATSQWVLVSRDGTQTETVIYSATGAPDVTEEMRTVADENGVLLSRVKALWQNFGFGSARIEQTVDPDGKALKTTWSYNTDSGAPSSFGRVAQRVDPSGAWIKYTYHATLPEVSKSVRGWLDAPLTAPESQCRVQEREWNPAGSPAGTALETEKLNGIIVSRKFIVEYADGYDEIQCLTQTAAWNDAANLVTKTRYCTDDVFKTKLKSVIRPDGTGTLYSYEIDGATLDDSTVLTSVISDGALNAGASAVTEGSRTTILTNSQGGVIASQVVDIVSQNLMDQRIATGVDSFGRPTSEQFLDGTTELTTYGCCGVSSRTDRRGMTTTYAELAQSHKSIRTLPALGISWETLGAGLEMTDTRIGSDNTSIQIAHSEYNLAGQLISNSSSAGGNATYESSIDANHLTINSALYADNGTRIDTLYPDGTAKSVTGTAVSPLRYEYGVASDGANWIKAIALDASGGDTQEFVKTWRDLAGRVFKIEKSGGGASLAYFNGKGQLAKVLDPDGVATLYTYDNRGRLNRSVLDMNRNGTIDDGGTDRISEFADTVTTHGTTVVRRTTQIVWPADNNAAATAVVNTTDRSVDGDDTWVDEGGLVTHSHVSHAGSGAWTETITAPDNSRLVRDFANGRLATEERKDGNDTPVSSTSYAYDEHGRLSQTQDGRGATVTYGYDADDRIHTVTGPDPGNGGATPASTITYDSMGREGAVTDAAGGAVNYTYWPTGSVHSVGGNRAYPISYTYTPQGRMETMNTATGTTTWIYEAASGRLLKKLDAANKGAVYSYTMGGRLLTKTNARGTVATYGYNNAGENSSIAYDDGITPSAIYAFNRLGQLVQVDASGVSRVLSSNVWGQLTAESFTGGPLGGLGITHSLDSLRRANGLAAALGEIALATGAYGYDDASRLKTVTSGDQSATYDYDSAEGGLISQVTFKQGTTTRMTIPRHFDLARRLEWLKSLNALGQEMFKAGYNYNARSQRTDVTREDGARWVWGYNDRGEVTSGGKNFPDDTMHPLLQYAWAFDGIGNRTSRSKGGTDSAHTGAYSPNSRNQYSSRTVPSLLSVTGEAASTASVVVQAGPAQRRGAAFWREWSVDNSGAAVRENVRVAAAKPGAGPGGADLASTQAGKLYLAPATEIFTYDDDGNLTGDSRWAYAWDAENRLLSMQENPAALPVGWVRSRLEFAYDPGGRRVRKTVKNWNGAAWATVADTAFVYDGWNLIAELDVSVSPQLRVSYAWGLDLSGSPQGAGGVGGLLWARSVAGSSTLVDYPAYDGNGNIIGYVDGSSGSPVLKLDYDPFGNVVMAASMGDSASSAAARNIPFRFSTKYTDRETSLSYYGYRYYSAELGRWLSPDPIAEGGGINLYGMIGNDPVNTVDLFGLWKLGVHEQIAEEALTGLPCLPCCDKEKLLKGLKTGSKDPDIPDGLVWTGLFFLDVESGLFSDEHIHNYYRKWTSYRSHYGDLQWWHSMQSSEKTAQEIQEKMIGLVIQKANAFNANSRKDCEQAGRLLGFALHTIEDSFSRAHTVRDSDWSISRFQNYSQQDSHRHGEADKAKGSPEYQKAVDAVRKLLNLIICQEGNEAAIRQLLRNDVLKLSANATVGGTEPSYQSGNNSAANPFVSLPSMPYLPPANSRLR